MKTSSPHLIFPTGEIYRLKGSTSIGRSEQCSIRLDGTKVSRDHSHIYEIGGKYQIVDSQSRNGTYLNEIRLKRPTTLKSGDRISVGDHVLVFHDSTISQVAAGAAQIPELTMENLLQIPSWLLLADIKDSTALTQRVGVEAYSSLLGNWFNRCRRIIEEEKGVINSSTGDGLLAYWKDTDPQAAKRVATSLYQLKQIQDEAQPEFRVVIHYGNVGFGAGANAGEEQLSGQDVHFLFRMEKVLGGTGHLLGGTEATVQRLKPWMSSTEIGQFALKGFEGSYALFGLCPDETGTDTVEL